MNRSFIMRGVNPFTKEPIEFPRFGQLAETDVDPIASGIRLEPTVASDSRSHFRGTPLLSAETAWPIGPNGPLDFLACIDFAELSPDIAQGEALPTGGVLNVFYDLSGPDWSSDSEGSRHWKLIYTTDDVTAAAPPVTCSAPIALRYHSPEPSAVPPHHRLGGSANWLQGDPRSLLQLTSGHYLADPKIVSELHRAGLPPDTLRTANHLARLEAARALDSAQVDARLFDSGAADWRLLLQLDSDPEVPFEWGDGGTLYVLIPQRSLTALRFEDAWIVWQCY
jgi:hypothetical protein